MATINDLKNLTDKEKKEFLKKVKPLKSSIMDFLPESIRKIIGDSTRKHV